MERFQQEGGPDPLSHVPLGAVRVFDAVARSGSMSSAAKLIHVTPGAVSRQMAKLEQLLGVELLARSGRGVSLSPAGLALRPYARAAFDLLTRGLREARGVGSGSTVRVRCASCVYWLWLRDLSSDQASTLRATPMDVEPTPDCAVAFDNGCQIAIGMGRRRYRTRSTRNNSFR
jgi:DNA-binding transcriptional LysR family regulator